MLRNENFFNVRTHDKIPFLSEQKLKLISSKILSSKSSVLNIDKQD